MHLFSKTQGINTVDNREQATCRAEGTEDKKKKNRPKGCGWN